MVTVSDWFAYCPCSTVQFVLPVRDLTDRRYSRAIGGAGQHRLAVLDGDFCTLAALRIDDLELEVSLLVSGVHFGRITGRVGWITRRAHVISEASESARERTDHCDGRSSVLGRDVRVRIDELAAAVDERTASKRRSVVRERSSGSGPFSTVIRLDSLRSLNEPSRPRDRRRRPARPQERAVLSEL